MILNFKALGASMLSTGPLFVKFGNHPVAWWAGVIFTTAGPIIMAITSRPPVKRRRRKRKKPKIKTTP